MPVVFGDHIPQLAPRLDERRINPCIPNQLAQALGRLPDYLPHSGVSRTGCGMAELTPGGLQIAVEVAGIAAGPASIEDRPPRCCSRCAG